MFFYCFVSVCGLSTLLRNWSIFGRGTGWKSHGHSEQTRTCSTCWIILPLSNQQFTMFFSSFHNHNACRMLSYGFSGDWRLLWCWLVLALGCWCQGKGCRDGAGGHAFENFPIDGWQFVFPGFFQMQANYTERDVNFGPWEDGDELHRSCTSVEVLCLSWRSSWIKWWMLEAGKRGDRCSALKLLFFWGG